MSSKLIELTESSPSVPPPSVLHGSGILIEVLDPSCTEFLAKGGDLFEQYNPRSSNCHYCFIGKKPCHCTGKQASNVRRYLWSKKDGPFGKELPASESPTLDGTSGYSTLTGSSQRDVARWTNVGRPIPVGGMPIYSSSEVPISTINTEGMVKPIRRIADSSPDLDGEEAEVVPNFAGHPSNTSPSKPPSKIFQSQIIPSTPRNFQPTLSTIPTSIPPASPHSSHTRPAFNQAVRPSPSKSPETHP
ncbi:hypothetical protein O181_015732 [Austropuccinia psidii MF-1]|uniref:Uncharacterized protein n=1 Tax=Austropuccinia psidii MF-1 TaxID=1389203 RepID=A0A9Q3C2N1_9BASI|nr:hypothetical protein [Austropuccinia psidii MF-1]